MLGINQNASLDEIKKSYYKMAKIYHPDVKTHQENYNQKKNISEDKFKEITNAYQVLSNDQSRKDYDREMKTNVNQKKKDESQYEDYQGYYSYQTKYNNYNSYSNHQQYYYNKGRSNYNKTNYNYKTGDDFYYENPKENKRENQRTYYNANDDDEYDVERFFLYRDPTTGKIYKVRYNPNFRKSNNHQDNIYNTNFHDEGDEMQIGIRHLVIIFSLGIFITLFIANMRHKRMVWEHHKDAVIYKNTVYYPKGKDPIIEDLVKSKGYSFPKEIYDADSNTFRRNN